LALSFDPSSQVFNPNFPNFENGLDEKLSYFDLNAGIFWRTLIRYVMPSAGISVSHLNMPLETFATSSSGKRLPMKLTFNGEVILPVNSKAIFNSLNFIIASLVKLSATNITNPFFFRWLEKDMKHRAAVFAGSPSC
jgi:hypothetical protein